MKVLVCLGIASLLALLVLRALSSESPSSASASGSIRHPDSYVADRSRGDDVGYGGEGVTAWSSDTEIQEYFLDRGTEVTIADSRLQEGDWVLTESTHSAPYEITAIAPRGKDELYLGGRAASGEVVVEQWKFEEVASSGSVLKTPIRTELYRGSGLAGIRQLGADPEARFCLVLAGQGADSILYRMPVVASAVPVVEYSHSAGLPIGDMLYLSRYEHLSLGRVWQLSKDPVVDTRGNLVDDTVILLIDAHNDGLFEDEWVDSTLALHDAGVLRADRVASDFSR